MRLVSELATILFPLSVKLAEAENNIGKDDSPMGKPFAPNVRFSETTAINVTALNGTEFGHDEIEIQQIPSGILPTVELVELQSLRNTSFENDSLWEGDHNEEGAISITPARHAIILKAKAKQLKTLLSNCFIDGQLKKNLEKYHFARAAYEHLTEELQDSVLSETERKDLDEAMLRIHISILFSDMHANRVDKEHQGQHKSCIQAS